jgi:hypothetical protein
MKGRHAPGPSGHGAIGNNKIEIRGEPIENVKQAFVKPHIVQWTDINKFWGVQEIKMNGRMACEPVPCFFCMTLFVIFLFYDTGRTQQVNLSAQTAGMPRLAMPIFIPAWLNHGN